MEWDMESLSGWNGNGIALGMEWEWNGKVVPLVWTPSHLAPLSKGRCRQARSSGSCGRRQHQLALVCADARASSLARSSATPSEIALVNVKKRDRTSNKMEFSRKGGLCDAPSPLPRASSHRSHLRGDLASNREHRALGFCAYSCVVAH